MSFFWHQWAKEYINVSLIYTISKIIVSVQSRKPSAERIINPAWPPSFFYLFIWYVQNFISICKGVEVKYKNVFVWWWFFPNYFFFRFILWLCKTGGESDFVTNADGTCWSTQFIHLMLNSHDRLTLPCVFVRIHKYLYKVCCFRVFFSRCYK